VAEELYIVTVCGHGLGTALVMKMTLDDVRKVSQRESKWPTLARALCCLPTFLWSRQRWRIGPRRLASPMLW